LPLPLPLSPRTQGRWRRLRGVERHLSDVAFASGSMAPRTSSPTPAASVAGPRRQAHPSRQPVTPVPPPPEPFKLFKKGEVDSGLLKARFRETFGREAYPWQLEAAIAVLEGEDVILDVGTGSGKTFCASLPLLLDERDIGIVVSPISALMIDQAQATGLEFSAVAVCKETLEAAREEKRDLFQVH
jgi:superfamily II DNA helicase RecQ